HRGSREAQARTRARHRRRNAGTPARSLRDPTRGRGTRQGCDQSAVRFYQDNERWIIGGGTLLAVLLLWEFVSRTGLVNPLFISSPTAIARAGYTLFSDGDIWRHLDISGREFLLGY